MSGKTHAELIKEINCGPIPEHRHDREILRLYAHELDAAHKREVDVLKQRCAELNAEVVAKDEVIKRLNDAISEEQRRKMATAENPLAVGDCAKLREAIEKVIEISNKEWDAFHETPAMWEMWEICTAALAATEKEGGNVGRQHQDPAGRAGMA